jgi:hypothetical protein
MNDATGHGAKRLVRKQFLITPEQSGLLKARARAVGLAEAAIVRAALDRELGIAAAEDDWKRNLMALAGALSDESDLANRVARNRARWAARSDAVAKALGDDG